MRFAEVVAARFERAAQRTNRTGVGGALRHVLWFERDALQITQRIVVWLPQSRRGARAM